MPTTDDLFTTRKSLDQICTVPDKIISVYSLEKHVWADSNSLESRRLRKPELQTIDEFQIDPVRPFLNDILRNLAAPYSPDHRDNPIGQGYWIQAEFGSGKSHLLCFLSALVLGRSDAWEAVKLKEQKADRGKRESLFRFWEEGLQKKSANGRGVFVIVKTLVGAGGGTVGVNDKGQRLTEYILDAAKEQIEAELGKNLSLYPVELLADRFISEDLDRYRADLAKFLRDPRFFDEDEFEDVNSFIQDIQQNLSPEYKRSCGNKLWRFYTEYLKVKPDIPAETEDILKHLVETILAEGYCGVLLVLDEVSLFMKNRDDDQRTDDEKTLVVLSNRLAKVHNLPVWTVCAAQQAIESKMGVKNIIADDRLKLVKLLEEDKDYYDIVLARVREIVDPSAIANYYLYYKRGFTWPNTIGEQEFAHFFPFHKPAIEVLRAVTYELTTTRSAIHFMHQTLKHQVKDKGSELIRLWELFDEAVQYEEDPSGVHAGLVAIKTRREIEYRAYEACKRQIDGLTKGSLKVYRDKAVKTIQTLFLYHVARTRQQGLSPEEISNSVLIERATDATSDENIQHYENIAENLRKELRQVVETLDDDGKPRYKFDPVFTGVDPRVEFQRARDEAESNELALQEAWQHLLALDDWPVRTRQMTIDLSNGVKSMFKDVAPYVAPWEDRLFSKSGDQSLEVTWQHRSITGLVGMRDLARVSADNSPLPSIDSDSTDQDFAVFISTKTASQEATTKILERMRDPRVVLWVPDELTQEERDRLLDFAAHRKLITTWQGKESEDAVAVISWVSSALQSDLGKIMKAIDGSYARGRVDALNNTHIEFRVAGELAGVLEPVISRVLTAVYESRDIKFEHPFTFHKEDGVKVINGIVRAGRIPKGAKPNQDISAAQNFGYGLKIMKKSAEKELDVSDNTHVQDIYSFIDSKLVDDDQSMSIETVYKNYMGVGGPKDYGLSRRMVQIYLLCLVQQGKIRLGVNPKSGLSTLVVDYSNMSEIDFSAKVVDNLMNVKKVAKPENWEVLRPYAEKLLGVAIPATHDDAEISRHRTSLRSQFAEEKEKSSRTAGRAKGLFEALQVVDPYAEEMGQLTRLFATDLSGDDINVLLYALKEVFGYKAFDAVAASQTEVDDLANRLRNYRDLQKFLEFETELRAAQSYCTHVLPDIAQLKGVRGIQQKIAAKLKNPQTYIDSDVKLRTDLIGYNPPDPGDVTFWGMVLEYTSLYLNLHNAVVEQTDKCRQSAESLVDGDDLKALKAIESISVMQPAVSVDLEEKISEQTSSVFRCDVPSYASVEAQLKDGPIHSCGLTFGDADDHLKHLDRVQDANAKLLDDAIDRKLEVFLNPTVRQNLEQGKDQSVIAGLLECKDVSAIRQYLLPAVLGDPSIIDVINRYLKRFAVKQVRVADFKPTTTMVEKEQIGGLAEEFKNFLEEQLDSVQGGGDVLPMLQLE